MIPIDELRNQICDVEGFHVRIAADPSDVTAPLVEAYPYVRAANHEWTVAEWRTKRFTANYDALTVDVIDVDGSVVHGRTELNTIRNRTSNIPRTGPTPPVVVPPTTRTLPPPTIPTVAPVASATASSPVLVPAVGRPKRRVPRWAKIVVPVAALAALGAALPKNNRESDRVASRSTASSTTISSSATTSGRVTPESAARSTDAAPATSPPTTFASTTVVAATATVPTTAPPATLPPTTTSVAPTTVAAVVTVPSPPIIQPVVAPPPVAQIEPFVDSGTDPRFDTCKKAQAAGFGPYLQGQDPEYDWYRDADNDGIVCE